MVLFADEGETLSREDAAARIGARDGTADVLERELRDARDRLQSLIEEYETALEELKSSNEELVSVNEELQSTNEELEASKEELQSLNEELHTVNAELNTKVEELDRANADLQNLFESSQIGTVFLDHDLVIRSFTPSVSEVFNILPSDRGRPITDLSARLQMPDLKADIQAVLATNGTRERRVSSPDGAAHYLVRVAPYLDGDHRPHGVVVTFANVTLIAAAEAHQRVLVDELNHRVKNMLMVAIALLEQTAKSSPPEELREVFKGRLHAMARAYELVAQENWTDVAIERLVSQELEPFGLGRVSIAGPKQTLKPRQALALGMIVHELATNAAKYGALSNGEGRVCIEWTISNPHMHLTWEERDGPEVGEPLRRGLGMRLVDREARGGLNGKAVVAFNPNGLRVDVTAKLL
jgi:two-component system CheB/CheR fusion protein